MKRNVTLVVIIVAVFMVACGNTWAQSTKSKNAPAMHKYYSPANITVLDWELMQVNLLWHDSFDPSFEYVKPFPIVFDTKNNRFVVKLRVQDNRFPNDPESFFKLPRPKQNAVLMAPISHVRELLEPAFPEVKSIPGLLSVEFWYSETTGGGRTTFAKYQNGELNWVE